MYKYLLAYCIGHQTSENIPPKMFVTFDTATYTPTKTYDDLSVTRKLNLSKTGAWAQNPSARKNIYKIRNVNFE